MRSPMSLKPSFFERNEIELIRAGKQAIKFILVDEIAKPACRGRAFDQLLVPRLRQIAQLLRRDIADINLMRRISGRRRKAAQMLGQFRAKRRIGTQLAQRLRAKADQVRHMRQRK